MTSANHPTRLRKRAAYLLIGIGLLAAFFYFRTPSLPEQPSSRPADTASNSSRAGKTQLTDVVALANTVLTEMDRSLLDYRGRMIKRERVDGVLGEEQEMEFKIRTRRLAGSDGQPPQSMAVYLKFIRPSSMAGREVIWVENQNEGKLIVHESGFAGLVRLQLDPTGYLAMRGNLHPIMEIGFQNLVHQLIERADWIEQAGGAEVRMVEDFAFADRRCQLIQVRPNFMQGASSADGSQKIDFQLAEIVLDSQLGVPLRYAAYGKPVPPSSDPPLLEEYTYLDIELNVGVTDQDFNPDNPQYSYP